ncbi:MAG: MaoC family dehydratase [Betaproteobacteria bacterium]|nr:MaoC family dehydratase [Betaproteobacteria bacterium]
MSTDAATAATTYITPALKDSLNVWSAPEVSHPVDCSDIRKWAIAVYWPEVPPKIFWDEAYAKTTKHGGIIAPREFNPFAWPAVRPADRAARPAKRGVGERTMNGGQKETYGVPIRPGDVITSKTALVKMEENTGKLGLTLYKYTEMRWTNQKGEFVRSRISISIVY